MTTRLSPDSLRDAIIARSLGNGYLVCLLLCLLAICPSAKAQLSAFGNTGFETGDLTSWTTAVPSGTAATLAVTSGAPGSGPGTGSIIHSGTHSFQANVTNAGSAGTYPSLTHTAFTANANGTYLVSFWLWSGGTQSVNRPVTKLHIHGSGPSYDVTFQPSSVGWDEFHFAFKASGSTIISFTFEQIATFNLDDVRLFDQSDTGVDVATQYLWQWGMQTTNNSANTNVRKTPWTGGDNNITAQLPDGRVMWLFNDSFIGHIDYTTNLRNVANSGFDFVRNYVAIQNVAPQSSGTLTAPITSQGTFFLPPAADQTNSGAIYWPNDAITEGNNVQVLLDEPSNGGTGALVSKQIATLSPPSYNTPTYTAYTWGNFTLNGGDGYLYIYGSDGSNGMSVARVPYGSLLNLSLWQYWLGGTSWGAKPTTLTTVSGLLSVTRCLERLGPNNYAACGDIWDDMQFAQYPWGPWTKAVKGSPVDVGTSFYSQMSNGYYYYFILHKELAQNGVYTIGYCDNGGGNQNPAGLSEDSVDNAGYFSMDQKSKGYYAPRYIKTINLLTASPYTTTTFTDNFNNAYESVWWQPYGGTWAISNGGLQQSDATANWYSVIKGIVEGNLTYTADVTCSSGVGSGLVFRASTYAPGGDNYLGYNVLLKPGTGVVLSASTGYGGNTTLASFPLKITAGMAYRVKVVAYGTSLQIYVTDMTTPVLSVTDATYTAGGIGVRTDRAVATFDNLTAQALTVSPPTVTSFTPASGVVGSTVTINGTNFVSPVAVAFAGTAATISSTTTKKLTVTVPPGAASGAITVTTSSGSAVTTTPYTVGAPPVITSDVTANGKIGQPFVYSTVATNAPTSYTASGVPAGWSFDGTSGVLSGTPTAAGTFSVTLRASNAYGTGAATLSVSVQPQSSYTAWESTYFTAAQLQDASLSGPYAAPAGDGITNLMKYALNLDPNVSGMKGLPVPSMFSSENQDYLALTYTQMVGATDIIYAVQVSDDLQKWWSGSGNTVTVSSVNNSDGRTQTVMVRDVTPVQPSGGRFIRLNVTMP